MITRQEVAAEFTLDENGCIKSPGRFEAEPWWIVQVSEWDMDGGGEILSSMEDGSGEYAALFDVTDEDRAAFDLSSDTVAILYTIGDQGFCSVEELTAEEVLKVRSQAEGNAGPAPEDIVIEDARRGGVCVSEFEGRSLGLFPDEDKARGFVRAHMEATRYWPNVWRISDHGNAILLDLTEE